MRWCLTYLNLYSSINIPTQSPDLQCSPYFSCITLDYSYRRFGFKDKRNDSGIVEQHTLGCWAHAPWTKTALSYRYKLLFVTYCQKGTNSWHCSQIFWAVKILFQLWSGSFISWETALTIPNFLLCLADRDITKLMFNPRLVEMSSRSLKTNRNRNQEIFLRTTRLHNYNSFNME